MGLGRLFQAELFRLVNFAQTYLVRPNVPCSPRRTLPDVPLPDAPIPRRTKRHSRRSGVFMPCADHWPPKLIEGGGYLHRAFYRFSRPVSLVKGPLLWRLALAGSCCTSGCSGYFPAAAHHWHTLYSNSRTISSLVCFHGLARLDPKIFLDSGRGFKARIQNSVGMA